MVGGLADFLCQNLLRPSVKTSLLSTSPPPHRPNPVLPSPRDFASLRKISVSVINQPPSLSNDHKGLRSTRLAFGDTERRNKIQLKGWFSSWPGVRWGYQVVLEAIEP